ncbi:MAG: glycosyltransferase [Clostridia bacterium]|nr:glycosyltransferase [Clostridia bacterium]
MPSFEPLEWMPPTINLLKKLDAAGHEVVFITIFPCEYLKKMNLSRASNVSLCSRRISFQDKVKYTPVLSGFLYRVDTMIKKSIARRLRNVIDEELNKGGKLWIVNEMTVLLAGAHCIKNHEFAFLIYELHEDLFYARNIKKVAQKASAVVVPDYFRAHIMKSRYNLKQLPFVLPNRSDIDFEKMFETERNKKAIEQIKLSKAEGNRILVYMGGVNQERPLEGLLEAIQRIGSWKLAIIGKPSQYLDELQREYSECILNLGAFSPPDHLTIAQFCDIGVLNYVSINKKQGLNAIFCAPNKIYEYTGLGLPVIGNDIPGLRFCISTSMCGELVDYDDPSSIETALNTIVNRYEEYSEAARDFYRATNTDETLKRIISAV